ncbi:MAG TPA: copper chaperone PCu(A)C [Corynebacterium sp.]|nr:copper chaperone PCu(A)C [Corynebacterium sp.]
MTMTTIKKTAVAGTAALALLLSACADEGSTVDETTTGTETTATDATAADSTAGATAEEAVVLEEGVVRAKDTEVSMTAIFGTLHNTSDEELHVVGVNTNLAEGRYEIHEVVDGIMQEKEGGLVLPAGVEHVMEPGGDHFMIMDHEGEIPAGDIVEVTIELADGTFIELGEIPVRTMNAGDEDYGADGTLEGHGGGMDSMEHHDH